MKFLKLAKKNKEIAPESWENLYEKMIVNKIRLRYSLSAELAILRQRDSKPEEFAAYNAFVEECKASIKNELEVND